MTETRKLGRSGIEVSALGIGCWAIGGPFWAGTAASPQPLGWGEVDDDESVRAIRRALELGVNFFDTANVYGAGHSEKVLARALQGRRDEAVVATKFGGTFDEQTRFVGADDGSPAEVGRAVRASLRRLGTDFIDLYQLHINDLPIPRALELIPALEDLVTQGLIRAYGWSTDFPERAAAFAEAGVHCATIQSDLSVLRGSFGVIPVADEHDLGVIIRGPLAMGLLSGKYTADSKLPEDDVRGLSPEWMTYFTGGRPSAEFLNRIDAVRDVLTSGGRTLAQGALAWLWAYSGRTVPIPGCRTVAQVEENAGALAHGPLSPAELADVEKLMGR
ncbi:aldo/keto reductase [Dactylosporangium aurantiacum]|uniref:Aldo/keto reductase n=1 Tax=Dactylosporangium aurantiacum TaxID=35754 RepID=A0A9Q9ICJ5_9ACTN|nr:aldo/keto reductase [Dactylosporangium aurantiacum]MDG6108338.1 aldo/keto reductase [Dactylosporangium aurantiacum]UWZ53879.1 aldo/keto reductase [Dactylosporangium aurantiacum]